MFSTISVQLFTKATVVRLFRTFWNCSVLLLFTKSNPFLDPFLNQLYTEHPRTVTGVVYESAAPRIKLHRLSAPPAHG